MSCLVWQLSVGAGGGLQLRLLSFWRILSVRLVPGRFSLFPFPSFLLLISKGMVLSLGCFVWFCFLVSFVIVLFS